MEFKKNNEEYVIQKKWRAEEYEEYFYIGDGMNVCSTDEYFDIDDDDNYEIGNYFKTEEEAKKVRDSKECADFWAKVRAGEIGDDE